MIPSGIFYYISLLSRFQNPIPYLFLSLHPSQFSFIPIAPFQYLSPISFSPLFHIPSLFAFEILTRFPLFSRSSLVVHFFITSEKYPSIFCFQTVHFHSQNYLYSSVHILLSMSRKTQLEILSKRRQSYKADPDMIPSTHSLIISALLFLNFCPLYSSFPPLFSLPSTFFNLSLHIYAAFSFVPLLLSHQSPPSASLLIPYLS